MILDFSNLNKYFFNISNIHACRQTTNGKTKFTMSAPRHSDALLFFSNTIGVCYQKNIPPLYIPQGTLVYLPQGCQYIWENSPAGDESYQENLLFEFTLNHVDSEMKQSPKKIYMCDQKSKEQIHFGSRVSIVSTQHSSIYKNLFLSLITAFNSDQCLPLPLLNIAYSIFNTISDNCQSEKSNYTDARIIKDSIKHLENCNTPSKSIREIASACNLSISQYERVFNNYTGMSPTQYRSIYRINHIKSLLHNTRLTLEEVADNMGYCDSGYLCRIFKKKTGMTPKEYRKIYLSQTQGKQ